MKNVKYINDKLVQQKLEETGHVIEGLKLPEVFSIFGNIMMEIVANADEQGFDVRDVTCDFLDHLKTNVRNSISLEGQVVEMIN